MKKMTLLVATLATTLLLSGLALIAPAPALAATSTPGSDCGCATTGPYVAPKAPVDPEIEPDGSSAASNPKYRVEATGAWPDVTVQVHRLADDKVVLTVNGAPANWGFSPDQDRFVTHGIINGTFYVQLYDLTAANPGQPMWGTSTLSSENRVAFSPHGKYLAFTWQNNVSTDTVQHQFVDTTTGREFDVSYSYYIPAAGKKFGEVGFGFSPDAGDRAFFTSYVTSQTDVQNVLYNLQSRTTVWSHLRVGTGFWRFSPCGDVLGVVEQDHQIADNVTLIGVADGHQIAAQSYPIAYIALRATAASHIVSVDNVDQPALATNTAGATCADTQAPTWPADAALTASNVAKTSLTLTWPAATDDKAVTQYKVYKGATLLTTLGGTARTYNVTGLTQGTSYTFTVQAADAAGNTSTDGPKVTVRTAADAPAWPVGTTLVAGDVSESGATLRWGAASGTVSSYKIYRDGAAIGTVGGSARSYAVTDLAPGTSYLFKVEAVGSTGAESTNGPAVRVRTPGYQQLDSGQITGTIWWDDNSDQVQDPAEDAVDKRVDPDVGVYAYRIVDGAAVESARGAAVHADGTYTID
ncbi:MAG TPA: fibronectin type III domain-containing protein, partial [Marmoricola sp.]